MKSKNLNEMRSTTQINGKTTRSGIAKQASRRPQQGRSRQSLERMFEATEKLLSQRGSDEFTLNEVSENGKVSIGSIYYRFKNKDELIHAVLTQITNEIADEQREVMQHVAATCKDLTHAIILVVEGLASTLHRRAGILRPLMNRARHDQTVARMGKCCYAQMSISAHMVLLAFRSEIRFPEPEKAVASVYRILYSSLARYLGLGSDMDSALEGDWDELKSDLCHMCFSFLTTPRTI